MSYNGDPKWTEQIVLPLKEDMKCPTCGVVAFNVDDVMECLFEVGYYKPRHIPPKLIFTCGNPNCPDCDLDFYAELSVSVVAKIETRP